MIRAITSEDLRDCARLFDEVFSEWPYEESWSLSTQAHPLSQSDSGSSIPIIDIPPSTKMT